jgi:glycosyltransferase involved in cell wall biosynthesis
VISVVIATLPGREALLERALASVERQTLQPSEVVIELDWGRQGAAEARNRALERVTGEYVAVLDDDDELLPNHLTELYSAARSSGADVTYSDFITTGTVDGYSKYGHVPTYTRRHLPFDAEILRQRNYIPVTNLYKTSAVRDVGGWSYPSGGPKWEDWGLYLKMLARGAEFHYHQSVTWIWHFHNNQTAGIGL